MRIGVCVSALHSVIQLITTHKVHSQESFSCSGFVLYTIYFNMELLITQYKMLRLKALSRSLK